MFVLWQIVTILGIVVGNTRKTFVGAVRSQNLAAWERGFELYWNVYGLSRPLACLDRGFESRWGHGYLSVVSVVCCQVEVSATS